MRGIKKVFDPNFILNPDINKKENRKFYVALSRAKEKIFITVPTLSEENKEELQRKRIEIINLENFN